MSKTKEEGDEIVETIQSSPIKQTFYFPPQEGRDAFVCEGVNQADADAQYIAAAKN